MPNAVIYNRVSHANRSISVADQERENRATCERNGWPVRRVFTDDGISASRYGSERPEWIALKRFLEPGDILVVWEASRAGRDLAEYVALRQLCVEKSVKFCYSGKVLDLSKGDDRFTSGIDVLVAERESELIKERSLRGKRSAALEGRASGRPPWGYRQKVDPDTQAPIRCAWEPDPIEAPRVREAVRRFMAGETQNSIYQWLVESEGWTPSGRRAFQRALVNPALAGVKVHHGKEQGAGKWEPILSQQEHQALVNKVDALKRAYKHVSWPGREPRFLLTGIATCGKCGKPVVHRTFRDSRNNGYGCPDSHVSMPVAEVDREVEDEMLELLTTIRPSRYGQTEDPEIQQAIDEIAEIEREIDSWVEAASRREVTREAFVKIEKGLRNRIVALRPKTVGKAQIMNVNFEDLQDGWLNGGLRQRREMARAFLRISLEPVPFIPPDECIREGCGKTEIYARGLCRNCYLNARRNRAEEPMPPKLRKPCLLKIERV